MNSMPYSDYLMFVDESGDHSLKSIDPQYPVFVLDFCIFRKDRYTRTVVPSVQEFKFRYFGHDLVVLHERDIRKQKPPFVFLKSQEKREAFMEELTRLVDNAEFTIVASVIDKKRHVESYQHPYNPYHLALLMCMERAHNFLRDQEQHENITYMVVETRGNREDKELELHFRRIRDGGYACGSMPNRLMLNFEIVFADKKRNSAGLQLADLTARPIGRCVLDQKSSRPWEVIEKKLLRGSGGYWGHGLKVFPSDSQLPRDLVFR